MKNIFKPLLCAASLSLGVAHSSAQETIKVGEFASLTGREASFGQYSHHGTELAVDEINKAGGVLGRQIQLICEDDQSKAGEASTVVRKLISSDHIIAILGEVASSKSLEAAPICQDSKIPMISPSSTNPKVTEAGDYVFRVCFIDPFQGTVMSNFAKKDLKARNVAMLIDVKSDYSVGLGQFFKKDFEKHGGKIITEKNYGSGDKDFRAQLTAIRAVKPDAIFIPGYYTEVGLMAKQARQLGITVPLFGGDGWESAKLTEIGGTAMEGTYFSTHFSPEDSTPAIQEFVKNFKARYGVNPDAMSALGYDSAKILVAAIKAAGTTDSAKLRDAIAATKHYPGITGSITLDASRNANKPAVILTVKDGKFKYLETIEPE